MKALKDKYKALTEREQKLVLLAGIAIIIGVFYFGIWAPLNHSIDAAKARQDSQQKLLSWVQENALKAQQLRRTNSNANSFSGTLAQAVNRSTSEYGILVSRMQPQDEELQVWVDQASFNNVLAWLNTLEGMGVVILQVDIAEANAPGTINIRRLQLGKL
ncbi:type II secretion system protein GspM [Salinimonas sediminis]|uniref:Type II secretion system protein M n=1 Tax=Salinimonas sediminis TaxID=2303538 RepID=A0A346NHK3_9ALTE|nr:type II secretion system protein M [Salinimonas sediminis]AXR05010.1 type II secretion system protein M [Salinimonas sediminis]